MKLTWLKTLAEATATAKAQGKKILLIGGRENCSQTTWTRDQACEYTDPPVRQLIDKYLIPWFCDVDSCFEGVKYVPGTEVYAFPNIAVIDPLDTGKAIAQRTRPISVPVLYDWLKAALQVADPVVPPVPPKAELDLGRLIADFRSIIANLKPGDSIARYGGMITKSFPSAVGISVYFIDTVTGKKVQNINRFAILDIMRKLYDVFPAVKIAIDAEYTVGVPPVVPPVTPPPGPPPIVLTEAERLLSLVSAGDYKPVLEAVVKKLYVL